MRLIQWIPKTPSKIVIVGEAPGQQEHLQGIPFIGPEGKYLTKMLSIAGINKADCYVTNVAHKKPPGNIFYALSKDDIAAGKAQLTKDLAEWKPNVIIAVGAVALEALTGKTSIFKYRGATIPSHQGFKVLPTIHPGNLIRGNSEYEPIVINDLSKAKDESLFPQIIYPERDIEIIENISPAEDLFLSFIDYKDPLACDIESIGTNGMMTAYGFATSPKKAYVVGKDALKSPRVLRALSKFCNSNTPKVFHNALFDALHNGYYYKIYNRNIVYDTMIAQHAAMPVLPKSLGFCASIYTKEPYWKDESKDAFKPNSGFSDWHTLYIYNGKDCCLTYEVMESQKQQLDYWNAWPAFNMMMSLVKPCLRAMHSGMIIDQNRVNDFAEKNEKAIQVLEGMIQSTIGDFNPRSAPQKKELFYNHWKLPPQKNKGKISTASKDIEKLERFPTPYKPLLGLVRNTVKYCKRRDFYSLDLDADGRIRTALKLTGTYTGRLASSKSITGSGKNLLNIPKEVRHFFVADPGKILVQMDLSQAEARVVAALCKDEQWLHEFEITDLHTKVASILYNIPMEKVRKPFERQTAKRVAHATHYLLGWSLLSKILRCSAAEAKAHKAKYHEIRPNLVKWHDAVRKKIRQDKTIVTTFGRVIQFPGPINDETFRNATAAEPQSTSADYLNHAIVKMYYNGPKEFEFLLQVYDSILFQVPDNTDCLVRNIQALKELAEIEIDIHGISLTIPTDFEFGYSWGELNEVKSVDKKEIEKVYSEIHRVS
jgi:uracil-DNA glycosylase family 4